MARLESLQNDRVHAKINAPLKLLTVGTNHVLLKKYNCTKLIEFSYGANIWILLNGGSLSELTMQLNSHSFRMLATPMKLSEYRYNLIETNFFGVLNPSVSQFDPSLFKLKKLNRIVFLPLI